MFGLGTLRKGLPEAMELQGLLDEEAERHGGCMVGRGGIYLLIGSLFLRRFSYTCI